MAPPAFVEIDHAGLIARLRPRPRDYGWWLVLATTLIVWTTILSCGSAAEGLDATLLCMWAITPLFGGLVLLMGLELCTRRQLRLSADGVVVRTWCLGVERCRRFALRELQIQAHHTLGGRGGTVTVLELSDPGGQRVRLPLPGGLTLPERQPALDDLAWMAQTLQRAADAAAASPQATLSAPELQRILGPLLACSDRP